jgi:hypothetical protein
LVLSRFLPEDRDKPFSEILFYINDGTIDNVQNHNHYNGRVGDSMAPNYTGVSEQYQALATLTPFKENPGRQWMRNFVLLNTEATREDGCEDQ